jgi:hypothetical protein
MKKEDLTQNSGVRVGLIRGKKNRGRKSHTAVPLNAVSHQIFKAFLSSTILKQYFLYGRR